MKRFVIICVALVALLATNSSGTNYQPSDHLQTFSIHQNDLPVVAADLPAFEKPAMELTAETVIISDCKFSISGVNMPAYHDPDYGLNISNVSSIRNLHPGTAINTLLFVPKLE